MKKTESNRKKIKPNRKKRVKTEPNQFELVFVLKNRTELKPIWTSFFYYELVVFNFFFMFDGFFMKFLKFKISFCWLSKI